MFFLQLSENEYCISCAPSKHEAKLHVINEYFFPDDLFHHSLNSSQDMIKEFKTSVVTSYQSITSPFLDIDNKTIFSVRWDGTIPYHVICKVSDQLYTSITGSLQHFINYSRGSHRFAIFHLDNSFRHHFDSYVYGRANGSVRSQVLRIPREFFIQKTLILLFPSNFLGLAVNGDVTLVIFDTFVNNHILLVTSLLL